MKKVSALFCLFIGLAIGAHAQNCYTGPNHITPIVSSNPGFAPSTENLPCAVTGVQLSDTLYFTNYSSFSGTTVDSLTVDSIGNLPTGTCWTTNKANNTFRTAESGVVYVHGLNTAAPGQYSLSIFITAYLAGGIVVGPNANANTLAGLYYWIRVICPGTNCTALDTVNGKTHAYIPYTACSTVPTATISPSGQVSICPGSGSVTLTAGAGAGWTYRWSNAAHSTSQSITVSTPGSYTVTVYNGPDSAVSAPTTVANGTNPTVSISLSGPVTFCQGGSVNLTASANNQYSWSTNSSSQMITATQTGTYTVTVTNAGGCTASVSQAVTVNQAPNVFVTAANSTICSGQSDLITASGADSYVWNNAQTTASISVSPTTQTTYSVTGTSTSDGCTAAQSVNINVQSYPAIQTIVGNPSITPLQSYTYLVTATSGVTYTWAVQNGAIQSGQGTNTVTVIWGAAGPYAITLIQSNGCADTTSLAIVSTGIADLSDNNKWSVYPNPAHDYVTIHNGDLHDAAAYAVKMVNALGQTVHTQEITKNDTQIDMSGLGATGVYFLYISNGQNQVAVKKIILQ